MANEELESYRAEFTAFCEHMEVGLKTRFPSLTQKEVLAVIGISLFAETRKLERDNAALMEDAAAQIQIAKEATERAAGLEALLDDAQSYVDAFASDPEDGHIAEDLSRRIDAAIAKDKA